MRDGLTPDEITARKTHRGKDDLAFLADRKARKRKAEPPPTPSGNCCGNCPHWREPSGKGVYGSCRIAFLDRDGVLSYDEARERGRMGAIELRTAAGFSCSQWGRDLQRRAS